jgi:hypothetical protein
MQGLDLRLDLLSDALLRLVDHDHRAVGQVTDALAFLLTLAHDAE